jgi:hypothetical protein
LLSDFGHWDDGLQCGARLKKEKAQIPIFSFAPGSLAYPRSFLLYALVLAFVLRL